MDDIVAIIVCCFVFGALGHVLRALFGGERRNDFRRDRSAFLIQDTLTATRLHLTPKRCSGYSCP